MFARMTSARPNDDQFDSAIAIVKEIFASEAEKQQGYRGFVLLVDRAGKQLTGISLWESASDRQASAGSSGYYKEAAATFGQYLSSPAVTTDVDVVLFDMPSA